MNALKIKISGFVVMFLLSCLLPFNLLAQQYNAPSMVPPAPDAASLGKFGNLEPGLSSGAINIQIPLTGLSAGKLTVPVSLAYTSNGFKVDEMASRVGTGWRLNAGGVVTRTVYGAVDEFSSGLWDTQASSGTGRDVVNFLYKITGQGTGEMSPTPFTSYDGQPDVFNFNFDNETGSFIIQSNGLNPDLTRKFKVILLNHSGLKIDVNFTQTSLDYIIKITKQNGVQYIFNAIEASSDGDETIAGIGFTSCGTMGEFNSTSTAFYLTKIIHPNGEVINLLYNTQMFQFATGVSQTIYHINPLELPSGCGANPGLVVPFLNNSLCANTIKTTGALLAEINSSVTGKIKFNYSTRLDYDDKIITSIDVYEPGASTAVKKFALNYVYSSNRPFLSSIVEKDASGNENQKHEFSYNNLDLVPPQLSFAQDHWGFYNGKSNGTLIPVPKDEYYKLAFYEATADREPDPTYCKVGVLSSVKYPTGGIDSIEYEGNTSYQLVTPPPIYAYAMVTGSGASWPSGDESDEFTIPYKQLVQFFGECYDNTINPDDHESHWYLINTANSAEVWSERVSYGQQIYKAIVLEPGTYKLKSTIYGNADLYVTANYHTPSTPVMENAIVGGIRVSRMLTIDPFTSTTIVKKINYNQFSDPSKSSGSAVPVPNYEDNQFAYALCEDSSEPFDCGTWLHRGFLSMHSSSLINMNIYSSAPIAYANVTEVFGEYQENGIIQHQYTVEQDSPPSTQLGKYLAGTPFTSLSKLNGKEVYTGIFKKGTSGVVPVKKIFTHYVDDVRIDSLIYGYAASRNYDFNCAPAQTTTDPSAEEMASYNLNVYGLVKKWVYVDTIKTQDFDEAGTNYLEQISISEYADVKHALITKEKIQDSEQNIITTNYAYPSDYASGSTLYANMVSEHIINPVIEKTSFKNTTPISAVRTNYLNWGSTIYQPSTIESKIGSSSYQTRVHFYNYDSQGNVTCVAQEGGPKVTYLYSYGGQFPVAEIKNADYSAVETILGSSTINTFRGQFPDKTAVESFLAPLTSSKIQISNFVFRPMVGILSQTDAKGLSTYYEYDDFLRLKVIKDHNGDIIKTYCYNYAGQLTDCGTSGGGEIEIPLITEFPTGYSALKYEICLLGSPEETPILFQPIFANSSTIEAPVLIGMPTPFFYLDSGLTTLAPDGYYTLFETDPGHHTGYKMYYIKDGQLLYVTWCDQLDPH